MANQISRRNMTQTVNGKVTREPRQDPSNMNGKFYWWKKGSIEGKDDELAQEIAATIRFIAKHQSSRVEQLTVSTRLYGNSSAYNMLGAAFARSSSATATPGASRISYNLCSSVIDTLTAQIAKNKIVPSFITSGGMWGLQRKAEQLTKFSEGIWYEQNIHEKWVYMFRDSGIWGDGFLYVYRGDNNRVCVERALPHELLVDIVESIVDKPRQMHRVKIADRGICIDRFPEHEEDIATVNPSSYEQLGGDGTAADLITVAESWHLPSSEDSEDGWHVISLLDSGKVLFKEPWKKDYFPFVIMPYSKRPLGFWGQGACERLQNIQGCINKGMMDIQQSHRLMIGPKIYLPIGSKIVSQHINNELGAIIHGNEPPQYLTPEPIQAQAYQWVDDLIAKGYQQEGVSQLSANNLKPVGINSGAALRDYDNIAEDRQLFIAQRAEECALEITRQAIEVVKDIYKDKGSYKVRMAQGQFMESIDWGDINLDKDEYYLKAFPTSELPEEPSAKLETVTEYVQAGFITPRTAKKLLRMPDTEMNDKLDDAAEDLIIKSIEEILYDGKKGIRPDDEWDLQLAMELSLKYLNYAKVNNCPAKNIKLLREFKSYIDDELGLTAPPAPMPQAPGMMPAGQMAQPQAQGVPQPVSQLIPQQGLPQ